MGTIVVHPDGCDQRANRDQQRRRLVPQHELQRTPIEGDGAVENFFPTPRKIRPCWYSSRWRSNSEHIMGVSVSEMTAESRMVTLSVTANSRNSRPTMSPMNSSGISTAINDTVSETMVNPIWPEPCSAASRGVCPSSM